MVEQMFSDELLTQISGDTFWADNCENVAFNTYPAALTPDMRALRYLTAPNLVVSDSKDHSPGIQNGGPFLMMNPFSSRCCQHNFSMGWPYFDKHLWLATSDNGLCATVYSPSEVTALAGDGTQVSFTESTHYPFEDTINLAFHAGSMATFPLYLRIPGWCAAATVAVNGKSLSATPSAGQYVRLARQWQDGDTIALRLPMKVLVHQWPANHDCVSVNYGPLTFSLKIGERYQQKDSTRTAMGDSGWQASADPAQWPSSEIMPTTPWNYALVVNPDRPNKFFRVKKLAWPADDYPFTPDSAPLALEAKGRLVPQWTLDKYGLCSVLQPSPVFTDEPQTKITLIPMGAARLRISAFPVASAKPTAHHWDAP